MSDNNPAARITITPSIEWHDVIDSGLELRTIQLVFNEHRQRGEQKPSAWAIAPNDSDTNYYPHFVADQIQQVVDHYRAHDFDGCIEVRNSSPRQSAVVRYYVRDRCVVMVAPELVWPDNEVDAATANNPQELT